MPSRTRSLITAGDTTSTADYFASHNTASNRTLADPPSHVGLPPLKSQTVGGGKQADNLIGGIQVEQLYEADHGMHKRQGSLTKPIQNGVAGRESHHRSLPTVNVGNQNEPPNIYRERSAGSGTASKSSSGKPKTSPLSPEQAMKTFMHKLTPFEHHEIFNYPEVYFSGPNAKKRQGVIGGANNNGFDDEQGSYIHVPHDHICYRFEVLKVLGKGSFGQVCSSGIPPYLIFDYDSCRTAESAQLASGISALSDPPHPPIFSFHMAQVK